MPGSVYNFTVENQELFLKPDQIYCYEIALTAAESAEEKNNAKVNSKCLGLLSTVCEVYRRSFSEMSVLPKFMFAFLR